MTLSRRALHALRVMYDEDEELVYEKGLMWVGDESFGARIFFELLRAMAISHDSYSAKPGEGLERYEINETGRGYLREAGN